MAREKHIQTFTGGMNTVLAPELMENNMYSYMLNCNVTSTSEGNVGIITNPKGNIPVQVSLPEGENKTIGIGRDDESNKMYFAVWNSLGFHSWYQFDSVSLTVKLIFQSRSFSGDVDILKWENGKLILHVNIIDNNLLYWVMEGHPARKINIQKSIELSEDGYGSIILEEYIRASKKSPSLAPFAEYFTDENIPSNSVFGNLFQFAARFIYDDGEYSVFSDFSNVAIPAEENVTGGIGIPKINNGINVSIPTGGKLVRKIEVAMRKTDQQNGGSSMWVSVIVLDKSVLGIGDNTTYEYKFYNNNTYLSIPQDEVNKQQSDFPRNPKVQEYTYNRMVYGNYEDGFPAVKVDFTTSVEYDELFVPDGTSNVLNDPKLTYTFIDNFYVYLPLPQGGANRHTVGRITVGPDVKSGNKFRTQFTNDSFDVTVTATLNDTSRTIAAKLRSLFLTHQRMVYVNDITTNSGGFSSFEFRVYNVRNAPYISVNTFVTPVNYSTLKNTGNSVLNDKLGSTFVYAIRYENSDGERSLAYGGDGVVSIKNINELGEIKKVSTILTIKHKAPSWATRYSIVRTKGYSEFIQLLVQKINTVTNTSVGETYHDVIIGSLYAYQRVHPDTTLKYEFKKGDRIKLLKTVNSGVWSVPSDYIEYEVLDYFPEVKENIKEDIEVNGSNEVKTTTDPNNIGNNIVIEGREREIIAINGAGDAYILNSNITIDGAASGSPKKFPSYDIINRRGVLRIKMDPTKPIIANGSTQFSLVEIYKPVQTFTDNNLENYYDIGYKFEIYSENGSYYHRGNTQDQDATKPAIVKIGGVGNYVRNRELVTNNSEKNPQVIITSVEDSSYSDFYISDLNSYGRPTRLDDSRGEVVFDDRLVWSDPFIEDTKINGLNLFNSLNRVDYNDKYGSIQRIIFYEGRMYVFKFLKTGWVPVLGSILTDTIGNTNVAITQRLLPDKMEYFLWEGGVGNNPESIVKEGNDVFGVSPTSEVIFEIGGAGVVPSSKIYGIDNEARDIITKASKAGVRMIGFIDRKNNRYGVMIPEFNVVVYSDLFNISNSRMIDVPDPGGYTLVSNPTNGSVSLPSTGIALYSPALNFSGMDYFSYKSTSGLIRNVCVNVLSVDRETEWRPTGQYCITSGGTRTGEYGYSLLSEYDNISETFTGVTKPNSPADPDYVAPVMDTNICPIGIEFTRIAVLSADKGSQTIEFDVTSADQFNIQVRSGQNYSGSLVSETGLVSSGVHSITAPVSTGEYSVYVLVPSLNYDGVTKFSMKNAYVKSVSFVDLSKLTELVLDQSLIPESHNLVFDSMNISANNLLTKLHIIHHKFTNINLSSKTILQDINVSRGSNLESLTIGSWSALRKLYVHDSKFTKTGYTPSFVDSIITAFNTVVPNSSTGYVLQYGDSNLSGVKPSSGVLSAYNSLVSKGVSVIGVPPTSSVVYVNVSQGFPSSPPNRRNVWANLSGFLTVPISIYVEVEYRDGDFIEGFGSATINIPAGQAYGEALTDFYPAPGQEGINGYITTAVVSPNPAGGTNLIVNK